MARATLSTPTPYAAREGGQSALVHHAKLPGANCPLCGEGFPRLTRTPESEPVPWRGGYARGMRR